MDSGGAKLEQLSRPRLAEKVAWEGGTIEALRYGIRSSDIADPDVARLWSELETLYERMAPIARQIDRVLEAA